MISQLRPSYAEIDLSSLAKNYHFFLQSTLAQKWICPMVKANAYGHGDIQVVSHLETEGCRRFGVGLVEEGIRLRQKGQSRSEILVFGFTGRDATKELLAHCLTPVVSDFSQLEHLESVSTTATHVHLKLNTGMNRLGFAPSDVPKLISLLQSSAKIKVAGLATHLMCADDILDPEGRSQEQLAVFASLLPAFHFWPGATPHVYNSASALGTMASPDLQKKYAYGFRIGLSLYGSLEGTSSFADQLSPVMRLKSQIVSLQTVKKGQAVSYGALWTAPKDTTIGIVPLGYADGIPTQLSNRGCVWHKETRLPILGRVCMDYIMVDVSQLQNPLGMDVDIFGSRFLAAQVAQDAGTIPYDILTRISDRVPRHFVGGVL